MSSKRILHCIPSMEGGGAERQLTYVSQGLTQNGWAVHVALIRPGANFHRLHNSGAMIHQLSCKNNFDPMILLQLIQIIHKVQPHLIQTWIPQMDIFGGLSAILMKKPFIITERSCSQAYISNWKNSLRILVGRRAAAITANSEGGKSYWEDKIKHFVSIRVIRNSVPFDEIVKSPIVSKEAQKIGLENEIILFAGRFFPYKNLSNLMSAIRQVLAQRRKTIAILFGEGPVLNDLISIQNKNHLCNRIRIMGFTSQFWSWLKRANVFVSVSFFEGHPNTVLEAVASKCPVVISNIPAHREFLDENSAYFVSPFSPHAIGDGILRALSHPREAMLKARSAYNRIRHWTVESIIQEYIDLYEGLVN